MNRWYARRHRIVLALLALLALDAGVYFGWGGRPARRPGFGRALLPLLARAPGFSLGGGRRPAAQPEFDPARLERLTQEVSQLAAEVASLERVREQAPRLRPPPEEFAAE